MKHRTKILSNLNELLLINYEAEKIYLEALNIVNNENLKSFFRERGFERNEYGRQLRLEINNLGGEPKHIEGFSEDYYNIWLNFRKNLKDELEEELLNYVCRIKRMSLDMYDKLLHLHRLPISLCKLLVEQRDSIESAMKLIKANEKLVA